MCCASEAAKGPLTGGADHGVMRKTAWILMAALGVTLAAASAHAEPARYRFSIPAESYDAALIDFAVQADISIGGADRCRGRSHGLSGTFTIEEGLQRLLSGSQCRAEFLEPRVVRVRPAMQRVQATATPQMKKPAEPAPLPGPAPTVGEVLVTASRRTASSERVAADVSAVSGDQLFTTGAADIGAAADQFAGLSMTNLGPGRDKILLRGLSDGSFTGRARTTVGTYLDDIPVNYSAPDPDLRLADVEGIEVVRGPQGALFGSGSMSGVYRIVTAKPQTDAYHASLSLSGGWTEHGAPSNSVEGMINAPLEAGTSAIRLVGYGEVQGGYLDDVNLRQSNVDQTVRNGARAAYRRWLNQDWSVTLSAALQDLHSADTQYTTAMGSRRRANLVREDHKNDFSEAALSITGVGGWGRFSSYTGYVHHAFASRYDASNALSIFGGDERELGVYDEGSHVDMLVEDALLSSPNSGPLQWLAGVFLSSSAEQTPATLKQRFRGTGGVVQTLYDKRRRDQVGQAAVYGEASYRFENGWTLTAGGRLSEIHVHSDWSVVAAIPGGSRSFDGAATFSNFAPKLSLQHDLGARGLVYVLYSEGYREGGFNTGGLAPLQQLRLAYSPDRLENLELGVRMPLLDGRLDVRSVVFLDRWLNIQTDEYLKSGLSFTGNVGNGRIAGIEAEAALAVTPQLTLKADALFDSPSVTPANGALGSRMNGLPGVPDASAGALAIYRHPLPRGLALVFTAEAAYVGRSRLTFDPTLSPVMGGYVTGQLSAQLKARNWRLAAYVSNPTNETGDTFAFGNPFTFGQIRQVTPLRPRTLTLELSAGF